MTENEQRLKQEEKEANELLATLLDNRFKKTVDDLDFYITEYKDYERSGFIHTVSLGRFILLRLTKDLRNE